MDFKNFEYCINNNLINKNKDAKNWVKKELDIAKEFYTQAKKIIKTGAYESTEMIAYVSIFHSTRALLYAKGYSEKSHFCTFMTVLELYNTNSELCELIKQGDNVRRSREETTYGGKTVNEKEANYVLRLSKHILEEAIETYK